MPRLYSLEYFLRLLAVLRLLGALLALRAFLLLLLAAALVAALLGAAGIDRRSLGGRRGDGRRGFRCRDHCFGLGTGLAHFALLALLAHLAWTARLALVAGAIVRMDGCGRRGRRCGSA